MMNRKIQILEENLKVSKASVFGKMMFDVHKNTLAACMEQYNQEQSELVDFLVWMENETEFNIGDIKEILDDYAFYKRNCG